MMKTSTNSTVAPIPIENAPDPIVLQAVVDRRLALRLGLTLPVAAVVAALAGIGPQSREAAR